MTAQARTEQARLVGERLNEERKTLGLSLKALAQISGIGPTTLASYTYGKAIPKGRAIIGLHRAGVDVLYVLTGDRGMNSLGVARLYALENLLEVLGAIKCLRAAGTRGERAR